MHPSSGPPARIAVIGIGNDHRRDDGVGWAVVAGLARRRLPRGIALFRSDGEPSRLLAAWDGARTAIVVDAARCRPSPRPGRVHRFGLHEACRRSSPAGTSSHGFALADAVELARVLGRLPGELLLYAVEAADTGPGRTLSPPVAAAVRPLVARIARDLALLGGEGPVGSPAQALGPCPGPVARADPDAGGRAREVRHGQDP
ncbi:hydrogenase maturation protease [Streptomyces sp. RS10V-4]|uniref:hydrogenase maturation protease n=1 Tax=Streptomyces rhizoryzae TaxID=2932493 RepID=UPI0020063A80|nr:hydrogenase maturation protease [Streptomyces rhizoryzae]MCK7622192.1 hydrogenase maturation protease [Streptomyces rhizoryzae]